MLSVAKIFISTGSIAAMLAVLLGAFGSHGLKQRLTADLMMIYETAVQYHFYHALGLILVGLIAVHYPSSSLLKWSGWLMLAGILFFSGSLYILAVTGVKWLGAITPIGGTAFILAWLGVFISIIKSG